MYQDIRDKLIEKGVSEKEIAFIHKANMETRKAELFAKVRSGQVRFLLGSTAKMGAGTNVRATDCGASSGCALAPVRCGSGFADIFLNSKSTPSIVIRKVLIDGIIFLFLPGNDNYTITAKCS